MRKLVAKGKLKNREDFERRMAEIDVNFGEIFWQHDRVYVPKNYKPKENFPRLIMRTEMKAVDKPAKYKLILKRHIEDSGVNIVDVTVVKDYVEMVNIIHQLGFKQIAEVSKKRRQAELGGGVAAKLDDVDRVSGYFLKLEVTLEEDEKVDALEDDLVETLKALERGVEIFEQPYFELVEQTET